MRHVEPLRMKFKERIPLVAHASTLSLTTAHEIAKDLIPAAMLCYVPRPMEMPQFNCFRSKYIRLSLHK